MPSGRRAAVQPLKLRKRPPESRFTQQNLPAWRPVLTPTRVVILFVGVALVLVPIGVACLGASLSVVEYSCRYDDKPGCVHGADNNDQSQQELHKVGGEGIPCNVTMEVKKPMHGPVYVYFELGDFFQNHRRYVTARSDEQLKGEDPPAGALEDCEPQLFLDENRTQLINPCGLAAWSFFNDTYKVFRVAPFGIREVLVRQKGIAWGSDVKHNFAAYEPQNFNTVPELRGGGQIDGLVKDDEHFVVWMRAAAMPTFRKLWGVIDADIPSGSSFIIEILNRYNTYAFGGRKSVVLSTTAWLGGRNNAIGITYIAAGSLSLVAAAAFLLLHLSFPRKFGCEEYLSWHCGSS